MTYLSYLYDVPIITMTEWFALGSEHQGRVYVGWSLCGGNAQSITSRLRILDGIDIFHID